VIYEDATWRNKKLMIALNERPEVESCWQMGGKIWVKLVDGGRKIKIKFGDNLNCKLNPKPDIFMQPAITVETDNEESTPSINGITEPLHPTTVANPDVNQGVNHDELSSFLL
jgi:hypothetical protein